MTILDDIRDQLGNDVLDAADTLSSFIMDAATRTAEQVGFGYILVPDAPSTFPTLTEAYQRSVTTGEPLPISSENSDDVIYSPPSVNGALRFWHDVNHVRRRLDFGLVDELELSLWHLGELEDAGHGPRRVHTGRRPIPADTVRELWCPTGHHNTRQTAPRPTHIRIRH